MSEVTDADVAAIWDSQFGGELFNAYTRARGHDLYFSARLHVVKAMLRKMLEAEASLNGRSTHTPDAREKVGQ